jgi:hypothetical protein
VLAEKFYVFYFDLIGIRARLRDNLKQAIGELEQFQRLVRERAELHAPGGTLITLADNVWARVPAEERDGITRVVSETLRAAEERGFPMYFGAVTFGEIDRSINDAALSTGSQPTDIRKQHISMTSDPHLRAALAEKCSAELARTSKLPAKPPCIWVSEEVPMDLFASLKAEASFDLKAAGVDWRFEQSRFTPVYR